MRGNPGKIVQYIGKDGLKTGIAYHKKQEKAFIEAKKVFISIVDKDTYQPILENGKALVSLVDASRLRIIGHID
jgi:hypothetical protein